MCRRFFWILASSALTLACSHGFAQEGSAASAPAVAAPPADPRTFVEIITNQGSIVLLLETEKAPISVKNFLDYVEKGHYEGTIFHRVIKDFMIQGGGFDVKSPGREKRTGAGIKNEGGNGLSNQRYTVAMARTGDPNSATAQFFINTSNNNFLDRKNAADGFGYAVFAKVVKGIEVVDRIASVPVKPSSNGAPGDGPSEPITPVVIEKVRIVVPVASTPTAQP
jgi:cyclophilin family peptidyl-prolyl cis-trans isomerase